MTDPAIYVFGGQRLSAHQVRALLADAPLAERQARVLALVEGGTIVDVGCSTGEFVREASRRFPNRTVIGVDYLDDTIRIARLLHPRLEDRFRRMSAYRLEFPDASIDCVTLQEVLEHLEGAALALKEVNRVLRPGGALVASVPNPYYAGRIARFCGAEIANMCRRGLGRPPRLQAEVFDPAIAWDRHVLAFTPQTLMALLAVNGFDYVAHEYENGMPDPIRRAILKAMPFLGPTLILKVRKASVASAELV